MALNYSKLSLTVFLMISATVVAVFFANADSGKDSVTQILARSDGDYKKLTESFSDDKTCPNHYFSISQDMQVKGELAQVFKEFTETPAQILWTGTSKFASLYDPKEDKSFDEFSKNTPKLRVGQIVILDLTVHLGPATKHIPVGFKITKIDSEKFEVTFSYLKQNISQGFQHLTFLKNGNNTHITHYSCYRSGKKFRDGVLYPHIHKTLIREFYQSVFKNNLISAD